MLQPAKTVGFAREMKTELSETLDSRRSDAILHMFLSNSEIVAPTPASLSRGARVSSALNRTCLVS